MLQFLLDTDHLTLYEYAHAAVRSRVVQAQASNSVCLSVVTAEETIRGRLAVLARANNGTARTRAYSLFQGTLSTIESFPIIAYDLASDTVFQQALSVRIGVQDRKIAAIALANNLSVVTLNRSDFGRVPGLVIDDWSV
jgi:tRNA(fMet)-specific endonuclease VapC